MSHISRKKLQQEKEAYVAKNFSKEQARKEIAREEHVENNILTILKEEWDSLDEGSGSYPLDVLFSEASVKDKTLTLKEFTAALNRLSGDDLFRSRKRIRFDFLPDDPDWFKDSRNKPKIIVWVYFLRSK